jgi:hypothetical protein
MRRKDLLPLVPPGALLVATLIIARFLGSSILVDFSVAAVAASASVALGYFFSEDLRELILTQVNQARSFVGNLTNRAKSIPPVNTNAQK